MLTPYYDHAGITLYHADCRDVLPYLGPGLIIGDPPYGVKEQTNRAERGRSNEAASYDLPPVIGDDQPFDPRWLLTYPRLILWGANHYADRLPPSSAWRIWDKRAGTTPDDNADCELAWTSLGGPARIYSHLWRGMIKASERGERREHPTQKAIQVMEWLILNDAQPGELIIEPYLGRGPAVIAAKWLGYPAVGCDLDERYCELTARRLTQEVLAFAV